MKQIPILFSTPMVQAIMEGRKTQTRRVIKPQPNTQFRNDDRLEFYERTPYEWEIKDTKSEDGFSTLDSFKCPYGKPGDILWVRETFQQDGEDYFYKADCDINIVGWKPSIHMPKDGARIWLKVKNIWVERLLGMYEKDAIAEGVSKYHDTDLYVKYGSDNDWCASAYASFLYLWESIYGKQSVESNPWVWVIEFEPIEKPEYHAKN